MTWHYITLHYITLHYITLHYINTYMSYHTIKCIYTPYNYITRPFVHPYCPTAIIFKLVLGAEYPWDPKEVDAEQHSLDAMHGGYRIHRWWCIGCHLSMIFFLVKFLFLLGINGVWLKGIYQVWEWTKASTAIMCKFHNMHHHWTVRNLRTFATCASVKCKPITLSLAQFCLWLLIVVLFKGMRWEKKHPRITSSNTPPAALIFKPRCCMICGKVT